MTSIMLVEDDDILRENFAELLRDEGLDVETFSDSAAALRRFDLRLPDLAILDITLGKEVDAGFRLCTELRKRSETVPIIFLTSHDSEIDKISGMRFRVDDYLTKHTSLEYLVVRIKTLLERVATLSNTNADTKDDLTVNMNTLAAQLQNALIEAKQTNQPLSVLHVEIGGFREINEVLGYQESDHLRQEVATRLANTLGTGGNFARAGDNSFVIFIPKSDAEAAHQSAHCILMALAVPVELAGLELDARPTIGIALYPGHGDDPESLLRRAAVANLQARNAGGRSFLYTGGQDNERTRRLMLMGDLRRAIERDELQLFCQPKVDIRTGCVCGAEALVRWEHPQHGMIEPSEFIKLAEGAGLITPLTYWVLGASLRQSYAWHAAGLTTPLAVNLSPHDLRDPKLFERIVGSLTTWGGQPNWLEFEITEGAIMDDPDRARSVLNRLKDLGVKLFVDDFGTGYSSLAYLQKLPIDAIKIDQSFIINMTGDESSYVIVRSTIEMAHNLGLQVVAEGVETHAIAKQLGVLSCDMAQGYCISRPIPVAQYAAWKTGFVWPN